MRSIMPWTLDNPVWFLLIKAWSSIGQNHISPLSVWWELQMEHCFHLTCTPRLITATEYYFLRCMLLLKVNITFELLMFFYIYFLCVHWRWELQLSIGSLCVWYCPEHCMFPAETVKEDYCSKSHSLCVWHCPEHCMFPAETVKEDSFPKAILYVYGTAQSTACFLQRQSKRTPFQKPATVQES